MTRDQVQHIIDHKSVAHPTDTISLKETHISWVILADEYAYKIKRPLKLGFLDFSTLKKRKEFCEREVLLNRRLAPKMYLGIVPISQWGEQYGIGIEKGNTVDYAVWMKRMDDTKQMNLLLKEGNVKNSDILKLVERLVSFHKVAKVVPEGEDWKELFTEFEDILSVQGFLEMHFGHKMAQMIEESCKRVFQFLEAVQERIRERNRKGYVVDGHGDLHTRNIFLLEEPVIFDCIEFNDDFRKLDLLSEVAFLCMDLERYGRFDLSKLFCDSYFSKIGCIENEVDKQIFLYYKLYRANVRIKVRALNAQKMERKGNQWKDHMNSIRAHLELYDKYFQQLIKLGPIR